MVAGESDGRFEDMTISGEIPDAKAMPNYVESLGFLSILKKLRFTDVV